MNQPIQINLVSQHGMRWGKGGVARAAMGWGGKGGDGGEGGGRRHGLR